MQHLSQIGSSILQQRSHEKELLDLGADHYSASEYAHCMKMLFRINKLMGFFYSTVKILKTFPKNSSLVDVGCGDGLFLLHLSNYFPEMKLSGIDISASAITLAQQELQQWNKCKANTNISFKLLSHPKLDIPENSVDIILTTLMCHHLNDEELIIFLREALRSTRHAVIINDLHRHSFAHCIYRFISPLLFRNRLITHDGLISIRRSFVRSEWISLLQKAGIDHYQLKWCFPFRWQLILWKHSQH